MSQEIYVSGTTLYHVASKYLYDSTQWWRIADLNGIDDPFIEGITKLKIPALDASLTDGYAPI